MFSSNRIPQTVSFLTILLLLNACPAPEPEVNLGARVTFPDPALDAAVRESLGVGANTPLYTHTLLRLKTLGANNKGVKDLTGLDNCPNLVVLSLEQNYIEDVSPLAKLTNITYLSLAYNYIHDISSLENLTKLSAFYAAGNYIDDISVVAKMKSLTSLMLSDNPIEDLRPLETLDKVQALFLARVNCRDWSPISQMGALQTLNLGMNRIEDLSFLAGSDTLVCLQMRECAIEDLSQIRTLSHLYLLDLGGNPINQCPLPSDVPALVYLNVSGTKISSLSGLASDRGNLRYLAIYDMALDETACADIKTLAGAGVTVFSAGQCNDADECLLGDINSDGAVNGDDFMEFMDRLTHQTTFSGRCGMAGVDVVTDGTVDGKDFSVFTVALYDSSLSAPKDLAANASPEAVRLTWTPVKDELLVGYEVYRSLDNVEFAPINDALVRTVSFEDSTAERGKTYYYEVRARDAVGAVLGGGGLSDCSLPAMARAGQVVVLVPQVSGNPDEVVRVPISALNARGIAPMGMSFWLRYDTTVATYDHTEQTALTIGVMAEAGEDTYQKGLVKISSMGGGSPLAGEGHLFDVFLRIAGNAPSGSSPLTLELVDLCDKDGVKIETDSSRPGLLWVRPDQHVGDVNVDGVVTASDSVEALRMAVGLIESTPQAIDVGDMNGDRFVDSADAVMILRESAGVSCNPPQDAARNGGAYPEAIKTTVSRELQIGGIQGRVGDTIKVPVTINDATALAGYDIVITYPGHIVKCTEITKGLGSAGARIVSSIKDAYLTISFCDTKATASGEATLVELTFVALQSTSSVLGTEETQTGANSTIAPRLKFSDIRLKDSFGGSLDWNQSVEWQDGIIAVTP